MLGAMRNILVASALLIQIGAALASDPSWSIHLMNDSGWGRIPGLYVDSSGALGTVGANDPYPVSMCATLRLGEKDLSEIEAAISSIPSAFPSRSDLTITDRCFDEMENIVIVKAGASERVFRYSQVPRCLTDTEVPTWLTNLVDRVSALKATIADCGTVK
jgi:hypothetical protein